MKSTTIKKEVEASDNKIRLTKAQLRQYDEYVLKALKFLESDNDIFEVAILITLDKELLSIKQDEYFNKVLKREIAQDDDAY